MLGHRMAESETKQIGACSPHALAIARIILGCWPGGLLLLRYVGISGKKRRPSDRLDGTDYHLTTAETMEYNLGDDHCEVHVYLVLMRQVEAKLRFFVFLFFF